MKYRVHLKGKTLSNRVVQYRVLDPHEHQDNFVQTAKMCGKEVEPFELKKAEWRNGAKRFLTDISEPVDDPAGVKMRAVSQADLDSDLPKFFGTKDIAILEHLYRELHEVSQEEVDAIVGKALPVSED